MHPTRIPLIAGNWKMHHGGASAIDLAAEVSRMAAHCNGVEVVIAPPFTALAAVAQTCTELAEAHHRAPIGVAAQNLHPGDKGAFTGEVSGPMLIEAGCTWVIVGHSERRQQFGETDASVAKKAVAALEHHLHPIVCIGETLAQREAGHAIEVVVSQLSAVLDVVIGAKGAVVLAYEPVWAIGTGRNATPADAQEIHAAIRAAIAARDPGIASKTRVLYGGSVKGDNAVDLLSQPDLDGALVGGASLDSASFEAILRAARQILDRPARTE